MAPTIITTNSYSPPSNPFKFNEVVTSSKTALTIRPKSSKFMNFMDNKKSKKLDPNAKTMAMSERAQNHLSRVKQFVGIGASYPCEEDPTVSLTVTTHESSISEEVETNKPKSLHARKSFLVKKFEQRQNQRFFSPIISFKFDNSPDIIPYEMEEMADEEPQEYEEHKGPPIQADETGMNLISEHTKTFDSDSDFGVHSFPWESRTMIQEQTRIRGILETRLGPAFIKRTVGKNQEITLIDTTSSDSSIFSDYDHRQIDYTNNNKVSPSLNRNEMKNGFEPKPTQNKCAPQLSSHVVTQLQDTDSILPSILDELKQLSLRAVASGRLYHDDSLLSLPTEVHKKVMDPPSALDQETDHPTTSNNNESSMSPLAIQLTFSTPENSNYDRYFPKYADSNDKAVMFEEDEELIEEELRKSEDEEIKQGISDPTVSDPDSKGQCKVTEHKVNFLSHDNFLHSGQFESIRATSRSPPPQLGGSRSFNDSDSMNTSFEDSRRSRIADQRGQSRSRSFSTFDLQKNHSSTRSRPHSASPCRSLSKEERSHSRNFHRHDSFEYQEKFKKVQFDSDSQDTETVSSLHKKMIRGNTLPGRKKASRSSTLEKKRDWFKANGHTPMQRNEENAFNTFSYSHETSRLSAVNEDVQFDDRSSYSSSNDKSFENSLDPPQGNDPPGKSSMKEMKKEESVFKTVPRPVSALSSRVSFLQSFDTTETRQHDDRQRSLDLMPLHTKPYHQSNHSLKITDDDLESLRVKPMNGKQGDTVVTSKEDPPPQVQTGDRIFHISSVDHIENDRSDDQREPDESSVSKVEARYHSSSPEIRMEPPSKIMGSDQSIDSALSSTIETLEAENHDLKRQLAAMMLLLEKSDASVASLQEALRHGEPMTRTLKTPRKLSSYRRGRYHSGARQSTE